MRILITGGAGFIGKNLCLYLHKQGHKLVVIDNFITSRFEDFQRLPNAKDIKLYKGDIKEKELVGKIAKSHKFDQIYHLACPTGVQNFKKLAVEMLMTCSIGTKNILDLSLEQKSKVLLVSSSEIYGNPLVSPQTENYNGNVNPVGERSSYEEGKRFAESLTYAYSDKYGLNARIVRPFNIYGPYAGIDDTRAVPQFIREVLGGRDLTVKGAGNQIRTFCYIDDFLKGLDIVMNKGERGEVYNLGSDRQINILALAKMIYKLVSAKSGIKFIHRESHDHQTRKPDLSKVRKLGYKLEVDLEDGLLRTIEFMRANRRELHV